MALSPRMIASDILKEWGFKLNKYSKCVANKIINRQQCTIIWHMDNLKISHIDKKVIEDIIIQLNNDLETKVLSPPHLVEYLGMTFDYSTKGKVKISMYEY